MDRQRRDCKGEGCQDVDQDKEAKGACCCRVLTSRGTCMPRASADPSPNPSGRMHRGYAFVPVLDTGAAKHCCVYLSLYP
jgi:hypothetical protein